jgi:hypothetical protein
MDSKTRKQLRKIILEEVSAMNKPRKRALSSYLFEEFKPLDAGTNIKVVDPDDVFAQLTSKDPSAPIFTAMASAKPRGYNVDPEKCAAHFEEMGKEEFVKRLSAIQGKIPSAGLPKSKMPVLPNPDEKGIKGTTAELEDVLAPGGDYNVDFESYSPKGTSLSEGRFLVERWTKLAGILTEKIKPPAANDLSGGDENSKKYLKSGLDDGNDTDDKIPYTSPGSIKASDAIPTQTNILIGKTLGMAIPKDAGGGGVTGGPLGAYGGTDGEILDGHHRWAATMISNPDGSIGTVMNIDLAKVGGGDKTAGLEHLTAIGNAMGNPTKTEGHRRRSR